MRKVLLTPGPLTTSKTTRNAMLRDLGSREKEFVSITQLVRSKLAALAQASSTHTTILLQGAGTYAIEAVIGTLIPRKGRLLVLANGAYGTRAAQIAKRLGRDVIVNQQKEDTPIDATELQEILKTTSSITDVYVVHLETTSGIINPIEQISETVKQHQRRLHIDAMSSFGGIPIDIGNLGCTSLITSSNKCLESVPGISIIFCATEHLKKMKQNNSSVCLDLYEQWREFEKTGQWRFTPPTHALLALNSALRQLQLEGGIEKRYSRYQGVCDHLIAGLENIGFSLFLKKKYQGPIIVTVCQPDTTWFSIEDLRESLTTKGIIIYSGKVTTTKTFRIGCIGAIHKDDIDRTLDSIHDYIRHLGPRGQ